MEVLELIDELAGVIDNARPVPLSDQVRVDKQALHQILAQLRATIPEQIEQVRSIAQEREGMLIEAGREAERIVKEAREHRERLISDDQITEQAERAADEIIADARGREREIRFGAEDYVDEILNTLEAKLLKLIQAVQRGRERLAGTDQLAEVEHLP
jgi:cell division septum initiation protein DivIVA